MLEFNLAMNITFSDLDKLTLKRYEVMYYDSPEDKERKSKVGGCTAHNCERVSRPLFAM